MYLNKLVSKIILLMPTARNDIEFTNCKPLTQIFCHFRQIIWYCIVKITASYWWGKVMFNDDFPALSVNKRFRFVDRTFYCCRRTRMSGELGSAEQTWQTSVPANNSGAVVCDLDITSTSTRAEFVVGGAVAEEGAPSSCLLTGSVQSSRREQTPHPPPTDLRMGGRSLWVFCQFNKTCGQPIILNKRANR